MDTYHFQLKCHFRGGWGLRSGKCLRLVVHLFICSSFCYFKIFRLRIINQTGYLSVLAHARHRIIIIAIGYVSNFISLAYT